MHKYYIHSFRLVLEEKAGKEIRHSSRLEFLEKFAANNFFLAHEEYNNSGPLDRRFGGTADLPMLRAMFLESDRLFVLLA